MEMNIDAKYEGNLTCAFKNDMRNLANFHQSTFESLNVGSLMGSIYPKQKMYELKIYREVTEELCLMALNIDAKL